MKIKNVLTAIGKFTKKNGTTICAGTSIVCTAVAVVTAVIGTTKAVKDVEAAEKEKGEKLTKKEVVKTVWKHYIPTTVSTAGSFAASIIGDRSSKKQISALTATIGSLSAAHEMYKEDIRKALGEEKYEKVQETIAENKAKELEESGERPPLDLYRHDGKVPLIDLKTGKWYWTTYEDAVAAKETVIEQVNGGWWAPVSSLLSNMDIPNEEIGEIQYELGWNAKPDITVKREHYSSGEEYIILNYDMPKERLKWGDS